MDCKYCGKKMAPSNKPRRPKETCDASCRQMFYLTKRALSDKNLVNRVQKAIRGG